MAVSSYSGVELPAAADRALALLARRPLSGALCRYTEHRLAKEGTLIGQSGVES